MIEMTHTLKAPAMTSARWRAGASEGLNEFAGRMLRTVAGRLSARQTLLRRSIQAALSTPGRLRVVIGSNLPWAGITHYGGTIRPSDEPSADVARRRVGGKPKYLTIPLGEAKGRRARDYQDLFPWTNKRTGKKFLAQRLMTTTSPKGRKSSRFSAPTGQRRAGRPTADERGRGLRLLFLLVPSVTIKGRPYMYFTPRDHQDMRETVARHVALQAG